VTDGGACRAGSQQPALPAVSCGFGEAANMELEERILETHKFREWRPTLALYVRNIVDKINGLDVMRGSDNVFANFGDDVDEC
jgi:hypothetical protein